MPYKDKEKKREYMKQYFLINAEKTKIRRKQYLIDNKETISNYYKQDFVRERIRRRLKEKTEFINNYKLSKGCSVCGYNKCAKALVFHHNGDKSFELSNARRYSIKNLKKEIDKCIVLCANCHAELHSQT